MHQTMMMNNERAERASQTLSAASASSARLTHKAVGGLRESGISAHRERIPAAVAEREQLFFY
jgi:hypothetical protein